MNFSLRTAFAVSHKFWTFVCSFSFVSRDFFISSLISFLTRQLFNSMLFNLHEFECFWVFSLRLVSLLRPLLSEKILQFSWICWGLFYVLSCGLSLKMFHVHFKKCIFWVFGMKGSLSIYQLSSFDLGHCSMPQYLCWYFVWRSICFSVGC